MQIITLYRIVRDDGGVTVTPNKPEEYASILYRLVADEGKDLIKGDIKTECIDTDSADGWIEREKERIDNNEIYTSTQRELQTEQNTTN